MRCLRRSSAVRLRGSPFPQPRGPLGLLRPSRRGSSPERDKTMNMDHDIAMDDCAALKLRKARPYFPKSPNSHEDQRGDGQGPPRLPCRPASATRTSPQPARRLHPEGARRRSEDLPPNRRLCRWSPRRDFHRHAQGGRDLPVADEQFRDRRVARPTARRPARGIRRRIHRHPLRACRPGSRETKRSNARPRSSTTSFASSAVSYLRRDDLATDQVDEPSID